HLTDDDRAKLVSAAQNNNARAVHLMLEAGWPTGGRGQLGGTALHWAAWHGNPEMTRELLKHGLSVQARDWNNDAPPMGWAVHGSKNGWHRDKGDYGAVVEALLDAGAEAPPIDNRLETTEPVLEVLRQRAKK